MSTGTPGAGPPPLPPPLPARPAPQAAARKGMNGCLIAVLVAGGLAIPVVAMLAAIALPAYNDYLSRSLVTRALAETAPLKPMVADFAARNGRCPIDADLGFRAAGAPGQTHAGVGFGRTGVGCAMEIRLRDDQQGPVHGRHLWLELDAASGSWRCSSDADDKYLPADCRG
jgi:type IV pilus assembly protein PilA